MDKHGSRWRRVLVAAAVVGALAGSSLQPAEAAGDDRWYAIAQWNTVCCVTAQAVTLGVNYDVSVADSGGHVLQTSWMFTGGGSTYWIEAGWAKGCLVSFCSNAPAWYWGDFHAGNGQGNYTYNGALGWYFDHYVGAATPNGSSHSVAILQDSVPGRYGVLFDWTIYGWATGHTFGTRRQQVGMESTSPSSHLGVTGAADFQYRDGNLQWVNGWNGATLYVTYPGSAWWRTYGSSIWEMLN